MCKKLKCHIFKGWRIHLEKSRCQKEKNVSCCQKEKNVLSCQKENIALDLRKNGL